jgi:hypothetical protein
VRKTSTDYTPFDPVRSIPTHKEPEASRSEQIPQSSRHGRQSVLQGKVSARPFNAEADMQIM